MADRIVLAPERRRRAVVRVAAGLVSLLWFYEYPLYALLSVYAEYQGWSGMAPAPPLQPRDYLFTAGVLLVVLFIYLKPRSYLRAEGSREDFSVVVRGETASPVSRADLADLEIRMVSKRKTASKDSGFITSSRITSRKRRDIVFYDAVSTYRWWWEKQVARQLERKIGDVRWTDKLGLLGGKPDVNHAARVEKRQKQIDEKMETAAREERSTPPRVVKGYGIRLFMSLFLSGFAAAFWIAGYRVAGGVIGGIAGVLVIDLVLAMFGFGQQPQKRCRQKRSG